MSRPHSMARGFSVIELMVALALSLLLIAAMLVSCLGTLAGSRQQRALSEMTQRAQLAFSLIRRDVQAAGYVHPGTISQSRFDAVNQSVVDHPIVGCSRIFAVPGAPVGAGACPSTGDLADAIEINFEASKYSALMTSNKMLADCQGAALTATAGGPQTAVPDGATRIAAAHRYFVDTDSGTSIPVLYCASSASSKDQLVPYVEQMQIRYGLSLGWAHDDPTLRRPSRFLTADEVLANQWGNVVAIRLCLLVRSPEAVLVGDETSTTTYLDCDGASKTSTDRILRRAFVTTIGVRNRGAM